MLDLLTRAKSYCHDKQIELIVEPVLGVGTDGAVWQTRASTAVKACERRKNYCLELECYRRFRQESITQLLGFSVPELQDHSDSLMVIEMSIVQPPYLLDFGKVYLDDPPEYFKDNRIMTSWLAECRDLFDEDWPEIQQLLFKMQKFGIYYVDPKPANICTTKK